jgi:hypothetical protein
MTERWAPPRLVSVGCSAMEGTVSSIPEMQPCAMASPAQGGFAVRLAAADAAAAVALADPMLLSWHDEPTGQASPNGVSSRSACHSRSSRWQGVHQLPGRRSGGDRAAPAPAGRVAAGATRSRTIAPRAYSQRGIPPVGGLLNAGYGHAGGLP